MLCNIYTVPFNHVYIDYNNKDKSCLSNLMELDDSFCDSHNQDWVDYKETHCSSAASAAHCSDKRRELSVSNSKSRPHMSSKLAYRAFTSPL